MYGSPLVLPDQFLSTSEPPLDTFLIDLHGTLSQPTLPITRHNSTTSNSAGPAPSGLFVVVRRDGHVPPLAPLYGSPYRVLKRSLHTFHLQIGDMTEVVSVHLLKPTTTSEDTQPALPPPRSRPKLPNARQLPPSSPSALATKVVKRVRFKTWPNFLLYQPNLAVADVPDALQLILPRHQPNLAVADDLGASRLTLPMHQSNLASTDALDVSSFSLPTASRSGGTSVEDELCSLNPVCLESSSTSKVLPLISRE